jgi:hypothetical protein
MRGSLAELAEIARGADQGTAKMILPQAIDDDAGGERIGRRGDGLRQFEPAAPLRESRRTFAAQDAEEATRSGFAQIERAAAHVDLGVRRIRLHHGMDRRQRLGGGFLLQLRHHRFQAVGFFLRVAHELCLHDRFNRLEHPILTEKAL